MFVLTGPLLIQPFILTKYRIMSSSCLAVVEFVTPRYVYKTW